MVLNQKMILIQINVQNVEKLKNQPKVKDGVKIVRIHTRKNAERIYQMRKRRKLVKKINIIMKEQKN